MGKWSCARPCRDDLPSWYRDTEVARCVVSFLDFGTPLVAGDRESVKPQHAQLALSKRLSVPPTAMCMVVSCRKSLNRGDSL